MKTKEKAQFIMNVIIKLENYKLLSREKHNKVIDELNVFYNKLHNLFYTQAKETHDKQEGKKYHIVNWKGKLILKHNNTGFTPRLK